MYFIRMGYLLLSVLVVSLVGILMVSNAFAVQDRGDFRLIYEPTNNYAEYEAWVKSWGYFENQENWLNQNFSLPYDVTIFVAECGHENAWYHPQSKQIVLCYELIQQYYFNMNEVWSNQSDDWIRGATIDVVDFVFYHEIGHALIDIHNIAIPGGEEDAADTLSAYILAEFSGGSGAGQNAIRNVVWNYDESSSWFHQFQESRFADEHSLDKQRMYKMACYAYGSNPSYNNDLPALFPQKDFSRCHNEYSKVFNFWSRNLDPIMLTSASTTATTTQQQTQQSKGGGCLIATATFGSEMAPQVQLLREIRDNIVLQTESGTSFMTGFNQFYYSFSPYIADYERENPAFKETVKLALTPLLTSLTLLQYADIDSESEILGYGIGVILLNIGMYFVAPAVLVMKIRKLI